MAFSDEPETSKSDPGEIDWFSCHNDAVHRGGVRQASHHHARPRSGHLLSSGLALDFDLDDVTSLLISAAQDAQNPAKPEE